MNLKYKILSYPLEQETPLYGDTPKIQFVPLKSIAKGDSSNTTFVSFCTHSGTHIDVPLHFSSQGFSITDFTIEDFIFHSPFLLTCPKEPGTLVEINDILKYEEMLIKCDILLIRTLFSRFRGKEIYRTQNPGISSLLAKFIVDRFKNIRAIGIDSISISSYQHRPMGRETHQIFLERDSNYPPMIIIEDLYLENLNQLEKLFVIPLFLKGLDGSPVTVFAQIKL